MVPSLTIGICAYNEELNIKKLLQNILFEQQLFGEIEVIVVCSGCTDNTVKIVKEFEEKDERIKPIIEEERKGKASAINNILSRAKSDNILFISADTLPKKNCLLKLVTHLEDPEVGIVCGKPVPTNKSTNLVGSIVHLLWNFHDRVFVEIGKKDQIKHASEIFCIRKRIVDKIPVEIVNDDAYLALMVKKKNWKIKYIPEAVVLISGPKTISDYLKQRRRIIWGHQQVRKITGKSPQYLFYLIPLHPIKLFNLTLTLIKDSKIWTILAFLLLEFGLNFIVIFDVISGRSYIKWSISKTTKSIINS